jgi:hypothetical protein
MAARDDPAPHQGLGQTDGLLADPRSDHALYLRCAEMGATLAEWQVRGVRLGGRSRVQQPCQFLCLTS